MPRQDAADAAQNHRNRMAKKSRQNFSAIANIGKIPAIEDAHRREACRLDLGLFLKLYFPHTTGLTDLSDDHTKIVIPRMQRACLEGMRVGNAVYRGFAKTTMTENTAIWSVVYGHRRYPVAFGSEAGAAAIMLDSIKSELQTNEFLAADFPEICYPIAMLEGKPQRCHSQTYSWDGPCQLCNASGLFNGDICPNCDGEQDATNVESTHIEWTAEKIALPFIRGAAGAGGVISTHGMTSSFRGLKHKRPDGVNQRPDFAIIDDPQTDESAAQPNQRAKRIGIITQSILQLGGHRSSIACVVNATIIERDDLVEQMMNRARFPQWQWAKVPMVRKWADAHETLWMTDYAKILKDYTDDDPDDILRAREAANQFYRDHREEMDAGCEVSWESCFDPDTEVSAIQHAYNKLIIDGAEVFASEYQQEPLRKDASDDELTIDQIISKANLVERGRVPLWATKVVGFIDVQQKVLYWTVVAFGENYKTHVVEYKTFPKQPRDSLALDGLRVTLEDYYATREENPLKLPEEAALRQGLNDLITKLCARRWKGEAADGVEFNLSRLLVDSAYNKDMVYDVIYRSAYHGVVMASRGRYYGATEKPMSEYVVKQGEELGDHWLKKPAEGNIPIQLLSIDTNYRKTFLHKRLATPEGVAGCMSLFGVPENHRQLAEHCLSESKSVVRLETGRGAGRTVDVWKLKPNRGDNHILDCLCGCLVACSEQGATLPGVLPAVVKIERRTFSIPEHMRR